jgi:hypothetical protein
MGILFDGDFSWLGFFPLLRLPARTLPRRVKRLQGSVTGFPGLGVNRIALCRFFQERETPVLPDPGGEIFFAIMIAVENRIRINRTVFFIFHQGFD